MNLRMVGITFVAAFVFAAFTRADDKAAAKDDDAQAKAMSQIAQLGQGVHPKYVETDGKGRIKSCVIVGQARIVVIDRFGRAFLQFSQLLRRYRGGVDLCQRFFTCIHLLFIFSFSFVH